MNTHRDWLEYNTLEINDAGSESDREFFERHPNRRHRVRPTQPGELPDNFGPGWTIVRQIRRGVRIRAHVELTGDPADSEANAARLFAEAMRRRPEAAGIYNQVMDHQAVVSTITIDLRRAA